MENEKQDFKIFVGIVLVFLVVASLLTGHKLSLIERKLSQPTQTIQPDTVTVQPQPPTKELVLREIILQGIKEPLIVYRQVMLETMHLRCTDCTLQRNNLFGFTTDTMLTWSNWKESIQFYKNWQRSYTSGDYYEYLIQHWGAPDMNGYVRKLKQIEI